MEVDRFQVYQICDQYTPYSCLSTMELNAEDIAIYMSEGDCVKEDILLMENILGNCHTDSSKMRKLTNDVGAIKINDQLQFEEDEIDLEASKSDKAYLEGLTVQAKLKGNLLALWDFDASSTLTGRQQPPPPQFLFVLERVVAQLTEPTPTLPYAFSLTFSNEDSTRVEQFRFSAFSEQDRTEWVQAIAACSHELLGARIRAIADGVKELGDNETVRQLLENEKEGSPFYEFVKKPALTRAPPLTQNVAATSSSSSSTSWSSTSAVASDLSPLEPDGDPDAFSALYANCITKKLSLETGRGVLRIREDMAEPKVSTKLSLITMF